MLLWRRDKALEQAFVERSSIGQHVCMQHLSQLARARRPARALDRSRTGAHDCTWQTLRSLSAASHSAARVGAVFALAAGAPSQRSRASQWRAVRSNRTLRTRCTGAWQHAGAAVCRRTLESHLWPPRLRSPRREREELPSQDDRESKRVRRSGFGELPPEGEQQGEGEAAAEPAPGDGAAAPVPPATAIDFAKAVKEAAARAAALVAAGAASGARPCLCGARRAR